MDEKRAVTGKLASKYRGCASRTQRSKILDEAVELTGYHRKYAPWLFEPRPVINEAHRWTTEALKSIHKDAPVPMRSFHSDNDSAFINEQFQGWCAQMGIRYTRSRPYHSNDPCYIEQRRTTTSSAKPWATSATTANRKWH